MLKDSITYWNSKLQTRGFFNEVLCLVERIEREDRVYPAQYSTNGEYKQINLDQYGSLCYWRKNGDVTVAEESNTGSIGVQYRTSIPLKLVGYIPKTYADDQYFADNVISEIIGILTTSNSALKAAFKAKTVRLTAVKYVTDARTVSDGEYENVPFEPKYSNAYFSIDFELVFVTSSQCYTEICSDLPINGYVRILDGDGNEIARINCGGSYVCEGAGGDATVENSNASYTDTVAAGDTLVLPDESFDVYVNGVLNTSFTYIPLSGDDINISA